LGLGGWAHFATFFIFPSITASRSSSFFCFLRVLWSMMIDFCSRGRVEEEVGERPAERRGNGGEHATFRTSKRIAGEDSRSRGAEQAAKERVEKRGLEERV
jgi:hypothetical protein